MAIDLSHLVGKTIESAVAIDGDYSIRDTVQIELTFTDGSKTVISASGCDEGGWLNVSDY